MRKIRMGSLALVPLMLLLPRADTAMGTAMSVAGTPVAEGTVTTLPVEREPVFLAFASGSLWVPSAGTDNVSRIDPASGEVQATIEVGDPAASGSPLAVAATEEAVWVSASVGGDTAIVRIDPATNEIASTIPIGLPVYAMVAGEGAVWVSSLDGNSVVRIDPVTNEVAAEIDVPGPARLAIGLGAVWVALHRHNAVAEIDPVTDTGKRRLTLGDERPSPVCGLCPEAVAIDEDGLWVSLSDGGNVVRLDPSSGDVIATIPVGPNLKGVAITDGAVWVASFDALEVSRIDPASNRVVVTIELEGQPYDVVAVADALWVTMPIANALARWPLPLNPLTPPIVKVGGVVRGNGGADVVVAANVARIDGLGDDDVIYIGAWAGRAGVDEKSSCATVPNVP